MSSVIDVAPPVILTVRGGLSLKQMGRFFLIPVYQVPGTISCWYSGSTY